MNTHAASYQVVIAGAGLVGALAALALKKQHPDWRVLMLEARAAGQGANDPRALALARRTVAALKQYGVWPGVEARLSQLKHHAIEHIHISDVTGPGSVQLDAESYNEQALGYVVPASAVQEALLAACEEHDVELRHEVQISALKGNESEQVLTLNDGATLHTQLLLSCDGSASHMRKLLGVQEKVSDYQQVAIAGEIELAKSHNNFAYERFTPEGPMALLPLGPRKFSLVWCGTPAKINALMELSEADFLVAAQKQFGSRAGTFAKATRLAAFPLQLLTVDRFVGYRWLLLGNACHTLHPVAGQGYNLGVRDVLALVERLRNASDPGATPVLSAYAAARSDDYQAITGFTDGLVHIFSSDNGLASFARRSGLKGLRLCKLVQRQVAERAMGLGVEQARWD